MFAILLIVLAVLAVAYSEQCSSISDYNKVDCGYMGINQAQCESKGCCWASSSVSGIPWCFYSTPQSSCFVYKVLFL